MSKVILILLISIASNLDAQSIRSDIKIEMLNRVNQLRTKGCRCGNKYMPAVAPVRWNNKLYVSSRKHALDMKVNDYFSHFSQNGENFENRFDNVGYIWMEAGENIAVGQQTISQVILDWKKSPAHCRMIMNPRVNEMGMAKQGKYWVQHFGKQIPPGAVKKGKIVYITQ